MESNSVNSALKHVQHHLCSVAELQEHGTTCLLKFHCATIYLFFKNPWSNIYFNCLLYFIVLNFNFIFYLFTIFRLTFIYLYRVLFLVRVMFIPTEAFKSIYSFCINEIYCNYYYYYYYYY